MTTLNCFKAYDIRGRMPDELNEDIAGKPGSGKPGSGLSLCTNNVVYEEGQSFGR